MKKNIETIVNIQKVYETPLNETYGYISNDKFNLDYIVKTVHKLLYSRVGWDNTYTLPNGCIKKYNNILFKQMTFDIPYQKMNKVSIILVKYMKDTTSKNDKFASLKENGDCAAFYDPDDSIISEEKNFGVIYLSWMYFYKMLSKNIVLDYLEEYLSHELRHYFDNTIGVFRKDMELGETVIEQEAEFLNIKEKDFQTLINRTKNKELLSQYNLLKNICYITDPTEMNAFLHSLISALKVYKRYNPNATALQIKNYISTQEFQSFELYNIYFIFDNLDTYKQSILLLCNDRVEALYYYFYESINSNYIDAKEKKKLNKKFDELYSHDSYSENEFKEALKKFLNDYWMKYIYKRIAPRYKEVYKNINKYIDDLEKQ